MNPFGRAKKYHAEARSMASRAEASFFLEVTQYFLLFFFRSSWSQRKGASALVPFVSRQKTQIIFAKGKNKFSYAWCYPPSILSFHSAHSRGGLVLFL
jgi:hypothetical protein